MQIGDGECFFLTEVEDGKFTKITLGEFLGFLEERDG